MVFPENGNTKTIIFCEIEVISFMIHDFKSFEKWAKPKLIFFMINSDDSLVISE